MEIDITWSEFKTFISDNVSWFYTTNPDASVYTYCPHNNITLRTFLANPSSEYTDFDTSYKSLANKPISTAQSNYDGRQIVHATPRYRGTFTCFSSCDDDQTNPSKVWGGSNCAKNSHKIGDSTYQTFYLDFNTIVNRTYLLSGYINWHNAVFDELTVQLTPQVTTYSASSGTDFDLLNGYLIIPNATSTGTIAVNSADYMPVRVTRDEFGNYRAGFWNCDYNTTTNVFENFTPAPLGNGMYNMFGVEIVFATYLNHMVMHGTDKHVLTAFDADELGHGTRLKFTLDTVGTDHDWDFNGTVVMFREKTS